MSEDTNASKFTQIWNKVRSYVLPDQSPEKVDQMLAEVRAKTPAPTFWLFGKTQSGKSSIVKYLTEADEATIGEGFRPCTKSTNRFPFPDAEAPLATFLDTRGVSDPDYSPEEDLKVLDQSTQLVIVTAKLADLAQADVINPLKVIRKTNPSRPILLALTCLHELDPTQQLPEEGIFNYYQALKEVEKPVAVSQQVHDLIAHHRKAFAGLVDSLILIDFTKSEEGYTNTQFGGGYLKSELIRLLPTAYRQSLVQFESAADSLKDLHWKAARPIIAGYASVAASVAAVPIPFLDLVILPAIQLRMCQHLAKLSGRQVGAEKFVEMALSFGSGFLVRQGARQLAKLVPVVGSAVAAATAGASTYALGKAYCLYDQKVHSGHVPDEKSVQAIYEKELKSAETTWSKQKPS